MNTEFQTHQTQSNGLAIAAMVLGIIGFVLAFIPLIGFLSWIISPLAFILGLISVNKPVGKGAAITGIVTGILGTLVCIAWATIFAAALSMDSEEIKAMEDQMIEELEEYEPSE